LNVSINNVILILYQHDLLRNVHQSLFPPSLTLSTWSGC